MKKLIYPFVLLSIFLFSSCNVLEDIFTHAEKSMNQSKPLTTEEVISGLKEALSVGTNNATAFASKTDGFYKNPRLFIPFPPEAIKVEQKLREIGMGNKVDEFIMTVNRGAEEAAKEAAPIFLNAIKNLTIQDAMKILKGSSNEATQYLRAQTESELIGKFRPVIASSLDKVSATRYWSDLINTYNKIPLVTKMNPDLTGYTTQKGIDGLFLLVADEEAKIRQDPAARVTDILKRVFGKNS